MTALLRRGYHEERVNFAVIGMYSPQRSVHPESKNTDSRWISEHPCARVCGATTAGSLELLLLLCGSIACCCGNASFSRKSVQSVNCTTTLPGSVSLPPVTKSAVACSTFAFVYGCAGTTASPTLA